MTVEKTMNQHEIRAWKLLIELGARLTELGGKRALDLSPIRITSLKKLRLFTSAFSEIPGRSGTCRRHTDRAGCPIYIVTDDKSFK